MIGSLLYQELKIVDDLRGQQSNHDIVSVTMVN